jgi:hypothetical membrane protein
MKEIWYSIEVTRKKIHEFGAVIFIVVGLLIPGIGYFVNEYNFGPLAGTLFYSSFTFLLLCVFARKLMEPLYRLWMLIALGLGFVMTRFIITMVYFFLITPIGIIRRLSGSETPKSIRATKSDFKDQSSFWIQKETPYAPESTERQF